MAILKKGSYNGTPISNLTYSNIDLKTNEKAESLKFDKEEYLAILEEARKEGYNQGLSEGYNDGYNDGYKKGALKLEEEKNELYTTLERDKEALKVYLKEESVNYINSFQSEMEDLIKNSINKIFLNCVSNEDILNAYLRELICYLLKSFKEFSIKTNEYTNSKIVKTLESEKIEYSIDNTLKNYSVVVDTKSEYQEYFLEEEFVKIKKLFV